MMERTDDRALSITKSFNASVELIWKMWTDPKHLVNWWGPAGFTSTIHQMDLEEGGEWKLTLHGPDGTNYANRSIYREIIPFTKIVFEHFNPHFITTVIFEPPGDETRLSWTMLFDTADQRETIVTVHKAGEGQKQNIEKLELYLSQFNQ
jgi:uncharacterized protein YndB with AHSA1/START domain